MNNFAGTQISSFSAASVHLNLTSEPLDLLKITLLLAILDLDDDDDGGSDDSDDDGEEEDGDDNGDVDIMVMMMVMVMVMVMTHLREVAKYGACYWRNFWSGAPCCM